MTILCSRDGEGGGSTTLGDGDRDGSDPLERLCEEFLARRRGGEQLGIEEFAAEHPDFADPIRDHFPILLLLEEAASDDTAGQAAPLPKKLGEYRIVREIGRGGMGVVYEAVQESLNRRVALKVLRGGLIPDGSRLKRFQIEAQAVAKLQHPNIVKVYATGVYGGHHYIAMQFVEGQPLDQFIEQLRKRRRKTPSDSGVRLPGQSTETSAPETGRSYYRWFAHAGVQVAEALAHAHLEGVLHRDIKPSNLILDRAGTVWVTDFGLAQAEKDRDLTGTGELVGTVCYMAPERFHGSSGRRSDIYGLGLTLYELVTLRRAFRGSNPGRLIKEIADTEPRRPRRIDRHVPRDLETIILKAIAKDPAQRYANAKQLSDDLNRFRIGAPVHAKRIATWERIFKWARRRPGMAALSLLSILALLVVLIGSLSFAAFKTGMVGRLRTEVKRSRAIRLSLESTIAERADPALALLLARDACRTAPAPEAIARLHGALLAVHERGTIGDPERGILHGTFSRTGELLVTASPDGTAHVWNLSGERLAELRGHTAQVYFAVFSPEGARILTTSGDGTVRTWSTGGDPIRTIAAGNTRFPEQGLEDSPARFSPEGKRILCVRDDRRLCLHDVEGETSRIVAEHQGPITSFGFLPNPEGDRFFSAGKDGLLLVTDVEGTVLASMRGSWATACTQTGWLLATIGKRPSAAAVLYRPDGSEMASFRAGDGSLTGVAIAPDGDRVAGACSDGSVRIWSPDGTQVSIAHEHRGVPSNPVYSPSGRFLITTGGAPGRRALVWDRKGRMVAELKLPEDRRLIRATTFSPDDRHVLTLHQGLPVLGIAPPGVARLWDIQDDVIPVLRDHTGPVNSAVYCPKGVRILTASDDGTARLWSEAGGPQAGMRILGSSMVGARFVNGGIVTMTFWGNASLWNLMGKERLKFPIGNVATRFLVSPAGDRLLATNLALVKTTIHTLDEGPSVALRGKGTAISPDGKFVLTIDGKVVLLWSIEGEKLEELVGHEGEVDSGSFFPEGPKILTRSSEDGTLRIWDRAGDLLRTLTLVDPDVRAARVAPMKDRILVVLTNSTAEILDLKGNSIGRLTGLREAIVSARYSPDGELILTRGSRSIGLWTSEGKQIALFADHTAPLTSAYFSPSGDRIITSSMNGTARVYLTDPQAYLELADARVTRGYTEEEKRRYKDLIEVR